MPQIRSVENATRDGTDGFVVEWEFIGFTEADATFRAVGMTALRFPTTIVSSEIVGVRKFGSTDYNVLVFVPTEGFMSAGITNPVEWMRDEFPDTYVR